MIEDRNKEPYISIWFGNFYKPAYDNESFVKESIKRLKELGFNSIMTDTKAWEDFHIRCTGGPAGQYVKMQELMYEEINNNNMGYTFNALYLNGDNLYPNIRFSPPIYGESVIAPDGSDGKWYCYWSDKAKASMIEHLQELMGTYGNGCTGVSINGKKMIPTCTMWDPIVAPSFDSEGRERYINWLSKKYGTIDALNKNYHTAHNSFSDLKKEDYWYECAYGSCNYTKDDLDKSMPNALMWIDNMQWKSEEICLFFSDMQKRIKSQVSSKICTCPVMTQWSYLLNVDTSQLTDVGFADLWDTANRGISIYKAAKYVDLCYFITVPITPYGDPDAYVSSCQHSMMRVMNDGKEFMGGIYWGRFLYNNIYEFLSPCEIIGSMVANGVSGYSSYGWCGLDDGGVLHRMSNEFNSSLAIGNKWAKEVIPKIKGKRLKQIAILFPEEMATYEPMSVNGSKERRLDLLGYYKILCNFGYMTDIISCEMIEKRILDNYSALIIPENDCYRFGRNKKAEQELLCWTENGGIIIASPGHEIVWNTFSINELPHEPDTINYKEGGIVKSTRFVTFKKGEKIAEYRHSQQPAAVKNSFKKGVLYSIGFDYGYSYCQKIAPHVPLFEKNNELYPISFMKNNLVYDALSENGIFGNSFAGVNVETAEFEDALIIVNHTSSPIEIKKSANAIFQYPINDTLLLPRSAVYIKKS